MGADQAGPSPLLFPLAAPRTPTAASFSMEPGSSPTWCPTTTSPPAQGAPPQEVLHHFPCARQLDAMAELPILHAAGLQEPSPKGTRAQGFARRRSAQPWWL
uniref:Uncharacterized protein n=1 Tax=Zea mays TaxID=4577 RepID=A0A804MIB5_MAIZE